MVIGCVGTKHLKEGEYLLYNQKFDFSKEHIKQDLKNQLVQRPNSRLWFLPISFNTYIYYQGLKNYDSLKYELKKNKINEKYELKLADEQLKEKKKVRYLKRNRKKVSKQNKKLDEGTLFMQWGEEIVVFDSSKVEKSRQNMEVYLVSNGWFHATTKYNVVFEKRLARVTYLADQGARYFVDSLFYDIPDTAVLNVVQAHKLESHIKAGQPYSQDKLKAERARLDAVLKNNGYFDFSRQYINFKIDSTGENHSIRIQLGILPPENLRNHKSFTVNDVSFTVGANKNNPTSEKRTFTYKGVTYNYLDRFYSEKVLSSRIHIKPGEPYSKINALNTQREIAGMDMFKFVNINYDSTDGQFLANIFVSPLPRYQWSIEAGLTVIQALPGPFASISLKQRNAFKTLGILQLAGNIGVEGVAAASNPNNILASLEAGANISITFPRFFLPISDEQKIKFGFLNPKSNITAGIAFTDRPEFTRSNLSAFHAYTWQPKQNILNEFRLLEVTLVKTNRLDSAYLERLKDLESNGNNLINSFRPSLITNQRFSRSVNKNNYGRGHKNASFFSLMVEPGGTFTNLFSNSFLTRDSIETYAYIKVDTDIRKSILTGRDKSLALRIRSGIVFPYGENGILPYEKYFFSGGSISNRAWKPRRLGPGSYDHIDENGQVSYQFEQQGEIILEANIEYRQKLIGMLNWAAFIDAGNIWTIKEDLSRPGSQFSFSRFYQEIAVGAGLGLRFDFSFFIIRFDAAAKIIDPARPLGKRFILSTGFDNAPFDDPRFTEPIIYTLSIGYPF